MSGLSMLLLFAVQFWFIILFFRQNMKYSTVQKSCAPPPPLYFLLTMLDFRVILTLDSEYLQSSLKGGGSSVMMVLPGVVDPTLY